MTGQSPIVIDVKMGAIRKMVGQLSIFKGRETINLNDGSDHPAVFPGVKYAVVWKPDQALFARLPDLEIIFSVGAGVDHVFVSGTVPDVPIVRFVDHTLTTRMSEWVCMQCLTHLRQQRAYDRLQREHRWEELPQPQASDITVGIMGMGVLGQDAALKLSGVGFNVIGWSRTKKTLGGIDCYEESELEAFLSKSHFLVGLLPLTRETIRIFNRAVFEKLARHEEIPTPVFINAGRGGSQVEADIIACLKDGTLGGVSLDVFETEPLPTGSPLWEFESAILTPHVAAVSDIEALGVHVIRQIERYESGKRLEHVVDRAKGY